ncbi:MULTISPECIES: LysR family transcriptional regulator [unclassified Adlercreutzia]|uniref:LysR family transcriptional regulator n=1 Tax=unclassified Adlercreutzia TaxID=2636013 RepID=UPI0013EE150F|nr:MULTISPECIES: LysR family transcriptional regulator [unclassified Adlercreutzia]
MDIRTMQYFLAVAREGSITKAAEALHMTQPPLSRQMIELEAELGVALLDRSGKRVALTEDGRAFRERAQEVVDLMESIRCDMAAGSEAVTGEVRIACGETDAVAFLARAAEQLRRDHPSVTYRLLSGDGDFVMEKLERNAADLGLLVVSSVDSGRFGFLRVPAKDTWGVLMREGDELARKERIERADLIGRPLLLPYRAAMGSDLMSWFEPDRDEIDVVATYDLAYNASRFAREGFGYAVALAGIVDVTAGSGLAFRPLAPRLEADLFLVWKRDQRLSRAAKAFLDRVTELAQG